MNCCKHKNKRLSRIFHHLHYTISEKMWWNNLWYPVAVTNNILINRIFTENKNLNKIKDEVLNLIMDENTKKEIKLIFKIYAKIIDDSCIWGDDND